MVYIVYLFADFFCFNKIHPLKKLHYEIDLTEQQVVLLLGYEPAGLTVHPPPLNDRGWVHFFSYGCLVPPKFFPQKKVDFVGDIKC